MPRNAEAHFHLGLMHMRKNDGQSALNAFERCDHIYSEMIKSCRSQNKTPPRQLCASVARLRSHLAQAAHLDAVTKYDRDARAPYLQELQQGLVHATNIDCSQMDVWNALGLFLLKEGGMDGSHAVFQRIRTICPDYLDAINNLGLVELSRNKDEAAVVCFQKVLMCDQLHVEALSNYGGILLRLGLYEAAIRVYKRAVEGTMGIGRGLCFAWAGLAIARGALGQLKEAVIAAKEAERMANPRDRARFSLLLTSMKARMLADRIRRAEVWRAGGTADVVSVNGGGTQSDGEETGPASPEDESDDEEGDPRAAMDAAVLKLRALAKDIKSSAASVALGSVLRLRHDHSWDDSGNRNFGAEAAERLVEALEKDDHDTTAWVQLSLLQMATGDYQSAKSSARQAVMRDASIESAWNAWGVAHQLTDDVEESQKAYDKAIEKVRFNYKLRRRRDMPDDCKLETEDVEEKDGDGIAPMTMAESLRLGDETLKDGKGYLEDWMDDVNASGRRALAVLYNNIGNLKRQEGKSFAEALRAYNISLKLGGEHAVVYNNLALLYISANRLEDAMKMLEHAIRLDETLDCAKSNFLKLKALMRQPEGLDEEDDGSSALDLVIEEDL